MSLVTIGPKSGIWVIQMDYFFSFNYLNIRKNEFAGKLKFGELKRLMQMLILLIDLHFFFFLVYK